MGTREVLRIIHHLPGYLVGADIVEYNPERDPEGITGMVDGKLLKEMPGRMVDEHGREAFFQTMKISEINYRHPTLDDGSKIYSLVKSCPPLDVNSQYFYYILCKDFSNTCVVAEYDRNLLGFVSAYLQPEKSQSLFVWQVAVFKNERRKRLAL